MEKKLYEVFFQKSPVAFSCFDVSVDAAGKLSDSIIAQVNSAFLDLFGQKKENLIGHRLEALFPFGSPEYATWHRLLETAIQKQGLVQQVMKNPVLGKTLRLKFFPLETGYFGCLVRDVTQETLLNSQVEGFMKIDVDMLCVNDLEGRFLKINRRFQLVSGYAPEELESLGFFSLIHEEDLEATEAAFSALTKSSEIGSFINRFRCKDGTYKYLEWRSATDGKCIYASARDVTRAVKKEEILRNAAIIDPLTGLYNRNFFYGRVSEEITRAQSDIAPLSMIAIDIDHFKYVNDIWGHPVGDEILERTARFLKSAIRRSDVLSRVGGEEFVVLLPNTPIENAMGVANKMHDVLNGNPHPRVGKITASFGVAERLPGEDFNSWYKRADDAVYVAKKRGRNQVVQTADKQPVFNQASVYIEWKAEWNSGNPTIDEQHADLVEIGNHLTFLSVSGAIAQQISRQIDELLVHVANHFQTEEDIIGKIGFPAFDEHRKIHADLLSRASSMSAEYLSNREKSPIFLSFMINDLIVEHMRTEDVRFFPYLSPSGK
jgi:diguanylate cyclase (GGDEF)-like protein/hemerythrin-like metal-binding protein/PAS domain S-box-containing protein